MKSRQTGIDIKLFGGLFLMIGATDLVIIALFPSYGLKLFGAAVDGPSSFLVKLHSPVVHLVIGYGFLWLRPWAWAPDSLAWLEPLLPSVTGETRRPDQYFNPGMAALYSKSWSADFLRGLPIQFLQSVQSLAAQRPRDTGGIGEVQHGVAL